MTLSLSISAFGRSKGWVSRGLENIDIIVKLIILIGKTSRKGEVGNRFVGKDSNEGITSTLDEESSLASIR